MSSAAYNVASSGNVQCSGSPGVFCFFCEYENNPDNDSDPASSLRSMVNQMVNAKCELPVICKKVQEAYNSDARQRISWQNPEGEVVENPDWTLESIKKHLVHSSEWEAVFGDVVTRCFHNIILAQNEKMFNSETGMPDPDIHKQFLETVKGFVQYKKSLQTKNIFN